MPDVILDRLSVIQRMLPAAVESYFMAGEPIVYYLTVFSLYEHLKKANKDIAGSPMNLEWKFLDNDEKLKKIAHDGVNKVYNFLKHSGYSPKKPVVMHTELADLVLYECCDVSRRVFGEMPRSAELFKAWWMAWNYRDLKWAAPLSAEFEAHLAWIRTEYSPGLKRKFFEDASSIAMVTD